MSEETPLLPRERMQRRLLPRHLQMIAIGGTIGTGLYIGGGSTIAIAGPLGALIGYLLVSLMVYPIVTSIGEMACLKPCSGSFNTYAGEYVDPALSFALGWNYYLQWAISLRNNL